MISRTDIDSIKKIIKRISSISRNIIHLNGMNLLCERYFINDFLNIN